MKKTNKYQSNKIQKYSFPSINDISKQIRTFYNKKDIEKICEDYIMDNYINNQQNSINFYDNTQENKLKNQMNKTNNFSIHSNDYSSIKRKYFINSKYSYFEKKIIKKNNNKKNGEIPLRHIYTSLSEEINEIAIRKNETINQESLLSYKENNDLELVENLEKWKSSARKVKKPFDLAKNIEKKGDLSARKSDSSKMNTYRTENEKSESFVNVNRKLTMPNLKNENTMPKSELKYSYKDFLNDAYFPEKKAKLKTTSDIDFVNSMDKLIENYCNNWPSIDYLQDLAVQSTAKEYTQNWKLLRRDSLGTINNPIQKKENNYLKIENIESILKEKMNNNYPLKSKANFFEKQTQRIENEIEINQKEMEHQIYSIGNQIRMILMENGKIYKKIKEIKNLVEIKTGKALNEKTAEEVSINILIGKTPRNNQKSTGKKKESFINVFNSNESHIEIFNESIEQRNQLMKEIQNYKQQYLFLKENLSKNKKSIFHLEEKINIFKQSLKALRKKNKNFLLKLLEKGTDVRSTGLSWILINLKSLGMILEITVLNKHFPSFFDIEAKQFLIEKAKLEIKLNELKMLQKSFMDIYEASKSVNNIPPLTFNFLKKDLNSKKKGGIDFKNNSSFKSNKKNEKSDKKYFSHSDLEKANLTKSVYFLNSDRDNEKNNENNENNENYNDKNYEKNNEKIIKRISTIENNNETTQYIGNSFYNFEENIKEIKSPYIKIYNKVETKNIEEVNDIELKNDINDEVNFDNKIDIYEDDKILADFKNREEFIQQSRSLEEQIRELSATLKKIQIEEKKLFFSNSNYSLEKSRILKEFETKYYEKRFKINIRNIFSALFGWEEAENFLNKKELEPIN